MMDNKFWMNVWAVIVAMLLMSWVVRPVLSGVLGVKEGLKGYCNCGSGPTFKRIPGWGCPC